MNIAGDKLLGLLNPDRPAEVRRAALVVLGEVAPAKDAGVADAVTAALADGDGEVRLRAIHAAGKLRLPAALGPLLERIKEGGPESAAAAHAAAQLGAKGTKALQELMPRVAPGLRRYIAAALAADTHTADDAAAMAVLSDPDPNVVEAAARSLLEQVPSYDTRRRRSLTQHLVTLTGNKKAKLTPASDAAVVRLLAALDTTEAAAVLWDRVLPPHPVEVRAAALQGVSKWAAEPSKEQLRRLFQCAMERDFRLAGPALMLLQGLPVASGRGGAAEWLTLLDAPDVAVRRLGLEKVGDQDTPAVAAALMKQLGHSDRGLADAALARLTRLDHGRAALTDALLAAETADRAWQLARAQTPFAKDYPAAVRDKVFAQAGAYLEANDRRAEPLLSLLREADAADLRDRVAGRAEALRKKKKYEEALVYLRWLGRDPASGLPVRLELAACGLKVSPRDLGADARHTDPTLQQFTQLAHHHGDEAFAALEKVKWLEPEELYYLGFHLAEGDMAARKLAAGVLGLVARRSARSKVGQSAKSKLRSAGLE